MTKARPFLWIGNHPATDLCNTEPIIDGAPVELLADYDDVVAWAELAGVLSATTRSGVTPREAGRTLDFVRRLRAALRAVLEPAAPTAEAVDVLDAVLQTVPGALHVDPLSSPWRVRLRAGTPDAQFRLDIAAAAVDIFGHDLGLVRRCANPACVLLFLDVSKSGRRRWCDMTTCGNRAKAAAHYRRVRTKV